ncbi:MAG TPA: hypothetical protein VGV59_00950 [Pyrinomonadaceae bacterium]|nr:hypothetical protein [Pyrinomonadaceae bacterium]
MSKLQKNWFEWVVFGVSLLLMAATLGYLVYDGATLSDAPPKIEIHLGVPIQRGTQFVLPVTLSNREGQTAEGVKVEVTVRGATEERGEFMIAFLPRGATREGYVAFQQDPRAGEVSARVVGYEKP